MEQVALIAVIANAATRIASFFLDFWRTVKRDKCECGSKKRKKVRQTKSRRSAK